MALAAGESRGLRLIAMPAPRCTVVVCTRDRLDLLDRCLEALSRQTCRAFDVLVVDSGPVAPAQSIAAKWSVRYHHEERPGLSRARNAGARLASGEVVAYTDDDALPEPGWIEALLDAFENPEIAAVTGRLRLLMDDERGNPMKGNEAPGDWSSRPRRIFDRSTERWFVLAALGAVGSGANMAVRRSVFASWPGFDERLGRGAPIPAGEENFAWACLIERGERICYTPEAIVLHPYPSSPHALRERERQNLRILAAFVLLLLQEFRRNRLELLGYLAGAPLGIRAVRWKPRYGKPHLSRLQRIAALLAGIPLYLRARRAKAHPHRG
jgi:O-antigen biosynthesis protein